MITVIGNSIVNGYPHSRSVSFTGVLKEKYGLDTVNMGVNGDTVRGVSDRFERDVTSHHPDTCLILSGTNDFIQGKDAQYVYRMLCEMKDKAKGIKVYFLTPVLTDPEMAAAKWIPADYNAVNEEMKKLAEYIRNGEYAEYLDVQKAVMEYSEGKTADEMYVDGIHPTEAVHEYIAGYIYKGLGGRK